MRAVALLALVVLAGCGAPAPPAGVTLHLDVAPLVLDPDGSLQATATVENPGLDPLVIGAACSEIADIELRYADGRRLGANATDCAKRDDPNVLAAGTQAGRRQTWPPAFWANHPEAGPGVYEVVATTTWRTADGSASGVETAVATFRYAK